MDSNNYSTEDYNDDYNDYDDYDSYGYNYFDDYLEPIITDSNNKKLENKKKNEKNVAYFPYPFKKEEIIAFLTAHKNSVKNNTSLLTEAKNIKYGESVLSFLNIHTEEDVKEKIKVNVEGDSFNILSEKAKKEQIQLEKRRRHQTYKQMDYFFSNCTYFDFFSFSAFEVSKNSKHFAQIFERSEVSIDDLFLAFFSSKLKMKKLLKKIDFKELVVEICSPYKHSFLKNIKNFLQPFNIFSSNFSFKNVKTTISSSFNFLKDNFLDFYGKLNDSEEDLFAVLTFRPSLQQEIQFSYEVHEIFEKSAENSLTRFKTPIITPEIIFITLMEEKELRVSNFIREKLIDETSWYLLRYKLMKRLYKQEINVRTQVQRNQQFFAYLLKTQISESSFQRLIKKKSLATTVSMFRNVLVYDLMKFNLLDSFEIETEASIFTSPERYYLT
jgi:hypothetical protein